MDFTQKEAVKNPSATANPISQLFYWWLFPLLKEGNNRTLTMNDLYDPLEDDKGGPLGAKLSEIWDKECKMSEKLKVRPRFYRALIRVFLPRYIFLVIILVASEGLLWITQSVFLYLLITSFEEDGPKQDQYLYGTGIIISTFLLFISAHAAFFGLYRMGMKMRISVCSLIYRKALKLSKASDGKQTHVGQLVNLMSNDANRCDQIVLRFHYFIVGPLQFVIILALQWQLVGFGVACLAGAGFVVALLPLQYFNSVMFAKFRSETAQRTDNRGQIMNEIIIAMRVIKMYAWERPFSGVVNRLRKLEVEILKKSSFLKAIYSSLFISASKVISYLTLLVFVFTGGELKASSVFFLIAGCNILRMTMVYNIPVAVSQLGEFRISLRRMEEFLLLEEIKRPSVRESFPLKTSEVTISKKTDASVHLSNVSANWTSIRTTLDDITANFRGDKLVMVVGSVGSGKTSLLHVLLHELPISKGIMNLQGRLSYAAQEPWIFAGSLRQNVLFGREFNKTRYDQVVEVSALRDDLKQLPYGENTIVGERGTALSGGQKARVNLARALYQEAEIYLLDDPLSAVDARVSRHIFEKCIKEHLGGKLRILVTHQLQYLPRADHIIVLDKGKLLAQGTYEQIIQQGVDPEMIVEEDEERRSSRKSSTASKEEEAILAKLEEDNEPERKEESMAGGSVTGRTYFEYFKAGGTSLSVLILGFGLIGSQVLYSFSDYWLSNWTREFENYNCTAEIASRRITKPFEDTTEMPCEGFDYHYYFYVYTGIVAGIFLASQAVTMYFFLYCMQISIKVHDKMFKCMVRAPSKFFDDNPSGRILNRFMKDIGSMDELLPPAFADALTNFFLMLGSIALVIVANYWLAIPAVFLFAGLLLIRRFYVNTARDVKRLEAMARSPMFTHLSATLQGLTTIRCSGNESILVQQFDAHQDLHSSAWYVFIGANRWFGVWLEMTSLVFLITVVYGFMLLAELQSFDGSQVGLAISSCLGLNGIFQWGMRQSAETENLMTSVERALDYCKIEPEAPLESAPGNVPPKTWPQGGNIRFNNVYLSYGEMDVLKNLSFEMKDREKIGIVGRTGAGKSTVISALFRMTEPRGDVVIDDIRINDIGLHDLRKSISIIPQDPVLFSGTIRYNLDPFGMYQDDELWSVIEEVELKDAISALDFHVADGGSNFSVGQRQLVCLARAILRKNKILIMDEATANVDPTTDGFIQKTIRIKFADCSIITIAHRLHSVMDCDKILVLDQGELMEYDHPHLLLRNMDGILTSMINHTGAASSTMLRKMAEENYKKLLKETQLPQELPSSPNSPDVSLDSMPGVKCAANNGNESNVDKKDK